VAMIEGMPIEERGDKPCQVWVSVCKLYVMIVVRPPDHQASDHKTGAITLLVRS